MTTRPPVVIEGYGSAGRRHERALRALGVEPAVVSRRAGVGTRATVTEAVRAAPDAVLVVASETSRHGPVVAEAARAGHLGPLVIEKPIAASRADLDSIHLAERPVFVAYNLRHHPLVGRLAAELSARGLKPLSVSMHAGQDLDTWRPGTDAAESYSASRSRGGGVLRDLSHELDLVDLLFGPIRRVAASGGRLTKKTVDSDDCWTALLVTQRGTAVALTLNYLDRPARRRIHVTGAEGSLALDFVAGTLSGEGIEERVTLVPDETTIAMWRDIFSHLADGAPTRLCDAAAAGRTLAAIEAIERSAARGAWVEVETESPSGETARAAAS